MNNASHVILPRPSRFWRRLRLTLGIIVSIILVGIVAAGLWIHHELSASLPQLDGTRVLPGLSSTVRVQRDGLGIPTISGNTRVDVARATGFVHAQERFFQMDLSRRQAAGIVRTDRPPDCRGRQDRAASSPPGAPGWWSARRPRKNARS